MLVEFWEQYVDGVATGHYQNTTVSSQLMPMV